MSDPSTITGSRKEQKRARILAAAEACLVERGYDSMKMAEVAERAGVAKGTVYRYFDGRDALCAAIAESHMSRRLPLLRAAMETGGSPRGALRRLLEGVLGAFESQPEHVRAMIDWWRRPHVNTKSDAFAAYRSRAREMLGTLETLIARGTAAGEFRDVPAKAAALHIWSSTLGVLLLCANTLATRARIGEGFDPAGLRAFHVNALLHGLSVKESIS